jgi:hypothetical protein
MTPTGDAGARDFNAVVPENSILSFPKIPSGADSRREVESSHQSGVMLAILLCVPKTSFCNSDDEGRRIV